MNDCERLTSTDESGHHHLRKVKQLGNDYASKKVLIQKLGDYENAEEKGELLRVPCKVGDGIWVINREFGEAVDVSCIMFLARTKGCIIGTSWIDYYDLDETLLYHINETQENYDTNLMVYPEEDCFATKEEAEKALKGE